MAEKSLRVLEVDKTFFGKLTNTITKLLIPTRVGINGMLINKKRNNLLKAFDIANNEEDDPAKKDEYDKKFEEAYASYLESVDKYIMDSIYKKVKNDTATPFEKEALSRYYEIVHLKETQYIEYKYRKQKYLLELDYESVLSTKKEKLIARYKSFYVQKMDIFYKAILKNYSVQLADNVHTKQTKNQIYSKIFDTIEEYIIKIVPIKKEIHEDNTYKEIIEENEKFSEFLAGKLDEVDIIEKKMILLGISRKLFTHSLPLIAAEQCYIKLLKDTREILVKETIEIKKKNAYKVLIKLIEDYNIKLLSTKIYWDKPASREEYKKFWEEYNNIEKIENQEEKQKQKEILFIKGDLRALNKKEEKYKHIIKFHKNKLVELGVMRKLKLTKKQYTQFVGKKIAS